MDSESRLRQALAAMNNTAYLTALSNMGEYKRAVKELEKGDCQIEFTGEVFTVNIGGEKVTLGEKPNTFCCSCPSPVVCRHILAAVMAVGIQSDKAENENEKNSVSQQPYSYLELDIEQISKLVGVQTYRSAVARYAASNIEINCGNALTASVNGYKVVFLKGELATSAVCSCKKSKCEHIALVLLKLYSERTGKPVIANAELPNENTIRLIKECLELMARLLEKGLYAATETDARLIMFYSLNLSKYAVQLGKNLRSLSLLLEEVLQNKMFADEKKLLNNFCRAFNLLRAVVGCQNADSLSRLIGGGRSVYSKVTSAEFISLGIYPFFTDSGYVGATHLMYCEDGICPLTALLPSIYEDKNEGELVAAAKLCAEKLYPMLQGHRLILHNFKKNAINSLSAGEDSLAEDQGEAFKIIASLPICETDYDAIERRTTVKDYFAELGARRYAVLPYEVLSAILEPSGIVVMELTYGSKKLNAFLECNEVTNAACVKLLKKEKKNGVAVLEDINGDYRLLTILDKKGVLSLYF